MAWSDLSPADGIVAALDHAGERPEDGTQDDKRNWSNAFADGCAVAIADRIRQHRELKGKTVKPVSVTTGTEPLVPLGAGVKKRIDVTVVDAVLGLELGASLKGLNFVDGTHNNYDKNLTGRLYELGDEVRVVHEHLPHAFMVGIFFLPIASCFDKRSARSASSFASTVVKLRSRSGRLDAALAAHGSRCDAAYVALYSHGDGNFPRGVTRFFDVTRDPPKRGRPKIETTLSLDDMVNAVVAAATSEAMVDWAEPEHDGTQSLPEPSGEVLPGLFETEEDPQGPPFS